MIEPLRPHDRTRLGRYELIGRLGQGGMGTVYLGRDPQGRRVAIKMVRPELADDAEFRGRFRSEVNRARQVPPFSTAEVLDADPDHDPPYLVVEYIDGPSLAAVVRDNGPLSGSALHGVAVGIATALTAIHGAGVIHRDLKPGNVLVAHGGIKVIDFGIARALEATSQHTRTDQMVGTVSYMAPERFEPVDGRPVTPAADIFAWGAVVMYAATGRTPFTADSAPATAMRILTQPPDLAQLPASLREPVEWALAKDPEHRPTARDLLEILVTGDTSRPGSLAAATDASVALPGKHRAGALQDPAGDRHTGRGDTATPVTEPRRRRRSAQAAMAAVAAVPLLGVAGLALNDRLSGTADPTPPHAGTGSASATAPASADPVQSTDPQLSVAPEASIDSQQAILRGNRRTLIRLVEIDRNLALDRHATEATASGGTGTESQFALVPYGVDYMIRTLNDGGSGSNCLGVKIYPDGKASTLVSAECMPSEATLFALIPTGRTDGGNPATYYIRSETYGFVQWSTTRKALIVEEVGDGAPLSRFSFVDRGPL